MLPLSGAKLLASQKWSLLTAWFTSYKIFFYCICNHICKYTHLTTLLPQEHLEAWTRADTPTSGVQRVGQNTSLLFSSGHLSVCRAPTWHVISERSRPSLVCFSSSTAPWSSLSVSLKTLVLEYLTSPREGGQGLHLGCQATQSWRMASTDGHSWKTSVCPALKVCLFIMSHQRPLSINQTWQEQGERREKKEKRRKPPMLSRSICQPLSHMYIL